MSTRSRQGNIIALITVVLGVCVVLLALFVLNYTQLIGTHKEAQTAIDAAALQAAKDMSRVVVDGPVGRIALVDDPHGDSHHPILGINTVLATLRIDAIIASKLENKSILYLVQTDYLRTKDAIAQLRQRIANSADGNGGAYDRYGQVVNIKQNALQAYLSQSRLLRTSTEEPTEFTVAIGNIKPPVINAQTLMPIPNPSNLDSIPYDSTNSYERNGIRYYRPNVEFPLSGLEGKVSFAAVAPEPSLVDTNIFVSELSGTESPVGVSVSCNEPVQAIANSTHNSGTKYVYVRAVAQAGGRSYLPKAGSLEVAFPGGFPADPPAQQGDKSPLTFQSVKSIINASQLDDASKSTSASPYKYWNKDMPGNWLQTSDGQVPSNGGMNPATFKDIPQRGTDDPSVCLSFLVYDWLRSMYIRPNMQSVINALSHDLKAASAGGTAKKIFTALGHGGIEPVYATAAPTPGITTAILNVFPGAPSNVMVGGKQDLGIAADDPRNLIKYNSDREAYARQQARMWGYIPADGVIPLTAIVVKINPTTGVVTTADGNPYYQMVSFITKLNSLNYQSTFVYNAVVDAVEEAQMKDPKIADLTKKAQQANLTLEERAEIDLAIQRRKNEVRKELFKTNKRLAAALINSTYGMEISNAIYKNIKALTGVGLQWIVAPFNGSGFKLAEAEFWPPHNFVTNNYSKTQLLNEKLAVPTTQVPSAPGPKDWCAPPDTSGGTVKSSLYFYKRTAEPIISAKPRNGSTMFLPALAQSAQPPQQFIFAFRIEGSAGAGSQSVSIDQTTQGAYAHVNTPKGQLHYQTTAGLVNVTKGDPDTVVMYQVQARDLFANAYPQTSAQSASNAAAASGYFAEDEKSDLAAQWAITCPIVAPVPPEQNLVAPGKIPVKGYYWYCAAAGGPQSGYNLYGYPWSVATVVPGDGELETPWGKWQERRYGNIYFEFPIPTTWHS